MRRNARHYTYDDDDAYGDFYDPSDIACSDHAQRRTAAFLAQLGEAFISSPCYQEATISALLRPMFSLERISTPFSHFPVRNGMVK